MRDTDCINECPKRTWRKAKELLFDIARSGAEVYFRGQADSKWDLTSGLGRLVKNLRKVNKLRAHSQQSIEERLEKELLKAFREAYLRIPYAPDLPIEYNEEFLAKAQHHSLPTSLLDWTSSPYIAAFFAFGGNQTSVFPRVHEVAIWALNWDIFELLLYYNHKKAKRKEVLLKKPRDFRTKLQLIRKQNRPRIDRVQIRGNPDRRMVYQEGLFTRAINVQDDMVAYLHKRRKFAPDTILTKIIIPLSEQAEALQDLSMMAISPVTLMGDADGAATTAFNSVVRLTSDWK